MKIVILTCMELDDDGQIVITSTVSQCGLRSRVREALAVPAPDISHEILLSEARMRDAALELEQITSPEWAQWAHV